MSKLCQTPRALTLARLPPLDLGARFSAGSSRKAVCVGLLTSCSPLHRKPIITSRAHWKQEWFKLGAIQVNQPGFTLGAVCVVCLKLTGAVSLSPYLMCFSLRPAPVSHWMHLALLACTSQMALRRRHWVRHSFWCANQVNGHCNRVRGLYTLR